jgi:hypothetical protein
MRAGTALVALVVVCAACSAAAAHPATTHGLPNALLIAAAKAAPLRLIDSLEAYCDGATPIASWLTRLTASEAQRIAWSAGPCELVDNLNPLDAGGSYCVQAEVILKRPKNRRDRPELEFFLEDPKGGRPGAVYAFRAMFDSNDGPDYSRFRRDFEAEWRARFPATPAGCTAQ